MGPMQGPQLGPMQGPQLGPMPGLQMPSQMRNSQMAGSIQSSQMGSEQPNAAGFCDPSANNQPLQFKGGMSSGTSTIAEEKNSKTHTIINMQIIY